MKKFLRLFPAVVLTLCSCVTVPWGRVNYIEFDQEIKEHPADRPGAAHGETCWSTPGSILTDLSNDVQKKNPDTAGLKNWEFYSIGCVHLVGEVVKK